MKRVAVKVAYLGRDFHGSQIQPYVKTVEGAIAEDLARVRHGASNLKMASRTDRGVNAAGNVASFDTEFEDNGRLLKALNAVSCGVIYLAACDVDEGFDPRHAKERVYRYVLRSEGIDIGRAEECASLFIGEHDFARFCKNDERGTVMRMNRIEIAEEGNMLIIEFRAQHFLWNMIRRIVGAISAVGTGKAEPSDVERALDGENVSFGLARPDALTLCDVVYDGMEFIRTDVDIKTDEKLFSLSLDTRFYEGLENRSEDTDRRSHERIRRKDARSVMM